MSELARELFECLTRVKKRMDSAEVVVVTKEDFEFLRAVASHPQLAPIVREALGGSQEFEQFRELFEGQVDRLRVLGMGNFERPLTRDAVASEGEEPLSEDVELCLKIHSDLRRAVIGLATLFEDQLFQSKVKEALEQ